VNCRAFEAWLDAGRPAAASEEAARHAKSCPDCAAAAETEDALSSTLRTSFASPDAGFTDRVLLRVAQLAPEEPRLSVDPDLVVPWWVQILREPAAIWGLLLGGLWTATANTILPMLRHAAPEIVATPPAWSLPGIVAGWSLPFLIAVALVLGGGVSFGLYRLATSAFSRMSGLAH
jgi:anti-sigma factor RsiW